MDDRKAPVVASSSLPNETQKNVKFMQIFLAIARRNFHRHKKTLILFKDSNAISYNAHVLVVYSYFVLQEFEECSTKEDARGAARQVAR